MKSFNFSLGGNNYRGNHIPVMKQFHVSRRLAPLLVGLRNIMPKLLQKTDAQDILKSVKEGVSDGSTEMMMTDLEPLLDALNRMSDEDAEFVIGVCMGSLQREIPNGLGWTAVWTPGPPGQFLFANISMPQMMQMVAMVVWNNLRGFMPGVLDAPPTAAQQTS